MILYILLALVLLRALFSLIGATRCRKLPPGPTPFPVLGNLLKLGTQPHQSLAELAKVHGPIMTLKLGHITSVVISSSVVAREALQKQDLAFSNRSIPNAIHAHDQYKLDANQHLRCRKVEQLIAYIRKSCQDGAAVDIGRAAFRTSLNLLSNTIFSVDLANPNEDSAKEFRDLVWNIMVEAGKPNLVDYFPELAKVDPQGIRKRMTSHFGKVLQLFGRLIDERLELRRLRKAIGNHDVIDILLNISEENPNEMDRTHIERLCLVCTCFSLT
ncbi:hypothetical protein Acr_00g0009470 [Actinidia rufa]|uniref:Geraniol 8-hydroxylase-like n=1 Tax=Actinidia rufa TaxID=165716 RepID=A0A7J0D9J6_9ERIC|nr:hypothetical protein Acr_00g0009470 [Actinidia rufa]